jgi:hypothetical protein
MTNSKGGKVNNLPLTIFSSFLTTIGFLTARPSPVFTVLTQDLEGKNRSVTENCLDRFFRDFRKNRITRYRNINLLVSSPQFPEMGEPLDFSQMRSRSCASRSSYYHKVPTIAPEIDGDRAKIRCRCNVRSDTNLASVEVVRSTCNIFAQIDRVAS